MQQSETNYNTTQNQNGSFSLVKQNNDKVMAKINEIKNSPITTMMRNLTFGGLILGGMFFASLFMFQILTGVIALFASVALLVILYIGLRYMKQMDPLIQQKTRNKLLEKMFEEARKNSIQQLNNRVLENADKLVNARAARNKMGVLVEGLKKNVDFNDNTNASNQKKKEIYERVSKAYETVIKNVEFLEIKHKEFEAKVIEYKDLEKFTKMAGEAMAVFADNADTKLNEMLSLESFEHIDNEFNLAIVTIENNTRDMEADRS